MFAKGEKVTFYPPQNDGDNLHFPAVIQGFTAKRIKVRVMDRPEGTIRTVTEKRINRQEEFPLAE